MIAPTTLEDVADAIEALASDVSGVDSRLQMLENSLDEIRDLLMIVLGFVDPDA